MEAYQLNLTELFRAFKSSEKGLSSEDAARRLAEYGYNELAEAKRKSQLKLFLDQFKSVLVAVLFAAAVISAFVGEFLDAAVIFSIIILNAFLGFLQERKAEHALEALKKISAPQSVVIRDGKQKLIAARELVPGDVIILKVGDKVPADCRIIEEMNLKCDEAVLTGESAPVKKSAGKIKPGAIIAERFNIAYSGTIVVYGHCTAVVVATGMKTEFGRIAKMLQEQKEMSPLQQKMAMLGKQLGAMVLAISIIVFLAGIWLGGNIFEMFLTAVALAVAAIPEGLPAVVTITLAIGLQRMSKINAIIRRLPAVETLGATSVICSDKTGTLTANEMTVRKLLTYGKTIDVTGEGYNTEGTFLVNNEQIEADASMELLLKIGMFCNDAEMGGRIGDPTELALLVSAGKAGITDMRKTYKRTDEIPFESERKMMSVVYEIAWKRMMYTKGAVESVIEKCTHVYKNGKIVPFSKKDKELVLEANREFASSALRVLAFAYKELGKEKPAEKELIFAGLQAMIDPPRSEVKDAIAKCRQAGITVVMITGDHKDTAVAIAKELAIIDGGKALTGEELDNMSDEELALAVEEVRVYARVSPEHKVRITGALKKKEHVVVAMTGDGVNDAPALKKADIGISMGITGTDVSKEASDMVLADDNFASIVDAVEEGRGIYDNIKKFVYYLLSANIGEVLIIFIAIVAGLFTKSAVLPLLPLHLLWVNLLTDGLPALALGVEPKEPDIMKKKPRNTKENILNRNSMGLILIVGSIFAAATLLLFYLELPSGIAHARTVAFTTIVVTELFIAMSMRSSQTLLRVGFFSNTKMVAAIVSSFALQLAVIYIPAFDAVFETTELALADWLPILLVSFAILAILELRKYFAKQI